MVLEVFPEYDKKKAGLSPPALYVVHCVFGRFVRGLLLSYELRRSRPGGQVAGKWEKNRHRALRQRQQRGVEASTCNALLGNLTAILPMFP